MSDSGSEMNLYWLEYYLERSDALPLIYASSMLI